MENNNSEIEFSVASFTSGSRRKLFSTDSDNGSLFSLSMLPETDEETKRRWLILSIKILLSITLLFSVATILLSVAAITLYQVQEKPTTDAIMDRERNITKMKEQMRMELEQEREKLQNLTMRLNKTRVEYDAELYIYSQDTSANFSAITQQKDALQEEINSNNIQIRHLDENTSNQAQEIEQTQEMITALRVNITEQITNASLNNKCYQERVQCELQEFYELQYWRTCSTVWKNATNVGYYLTGMHCEYESTYSHSYHISSGLSTLGDSLVRCRCHLLSINNNHGDIEALPFEFGGTCSLVLSYCPSQYITITL